jgi:hypothetical protein
MVLFEYWALASLSNTSLIAVGLRQGIALVLMFALYFSGKTLRGLVEPAWKDTRKDDASDDTDDADETYSEEELRESFEDKDD